MDKLARNNVVERQENTIIFTKAFSLYMAMTIGNDGDRLQTTDQYRRVLRHYNKNLESLSDSEIRAMLVLLGFYISNVDWRAATAGS